MVFIVDICNLGLVAISWRVPDICTKEGVEMVGFYYSKPKVVKILYMMIS